MNKCEYCGMNINERFPDRVIHKLCEKLKNFSNGRSLTLNQNYYMSYLPKEKQDLWPNLSVTSRNYCQTHQLVARIILGRDLIEQDSENAEVVDHINMGNNNKKNFSPRNLRVMNLKDHVSEHKKKDSQRRR